MNTLRDAVGRDLQWTGKEKFELRSGDDVLALLHAREGGADWTVGEAVDGRWALKDQHIGSGKILVITELDTQARVAEVVRGRKHGLLAHESDSIEFADGQIVLWKRASMWHDEWDWTDSGGWPLIHFQRGHRVVIEPAARSRTELSVLILVGWRLMQMQEEARKKAAVGAVAATTSSQVVIRH